MSRLESIAEQATILLLLSVIPALLLFGIVATSCEPECTDAEVDYCEREYHGLEEYCECLLTAGCERSCEWEQAGCDDE